MPPSLPRSALSSLARSRCSNAAMPLRSFSTTPTLLVVIAPESSKSVDATATSALLSAISPGIRPENPKFIDVPMPPQPQARPKRDVKGHLPPPRNLFPTGSEYKTTPEYFAQVTKEPEHEKGPANPYVAWKRRIATERRANLREGLVQLRTRKTKTDAHIAFLGAARSEKREKMLKARPRESDRLTAPTITASTRLHQCGPVPDPGRDARIAASAARVQAKEEEKREARKNALHTLYINARSFITTEKELDEVIDKIFVENPHEKHLPDHIWSTKEGAPQSIRTMLEPITKSQKQAMDYHQGPSVITGKRMKKIAEELTGGKMER